MKHASFIQQAIQKAEHTMDQAEYALRTERAEVSKLLNELTAHLSRNLRVTELPLVLNVEIGGRQYVSTRRLETRLLPVQENEGCPDPFQYTIDHLIQGRLIPDGGICVAVLPDVLGAIPRNEETAEIVNQLIEKEPNYEGSFMEDYFLSVFLANTSREFSLDDWYLGGETGVRSKSIALAMQAQSGSVYTMLESRMLIRPDNGMPMQMARKIKPDKDGNFWLGRQTCFWSEREIEVVKWLNDKFGRVYILQEGSSEKERNAGNVKKLKPVTQII